MSDIRKYIQIVEAAGYSVQVKSLDGVFKRFKSLDTPDAQAWRTSYAPKPPSKPTKPAKLTAFDVWSKVELAISNSFPDCDPIDLLLPWMDRNKIDMSTIDAVVRKHNKGVKGLYDLLGQIWDDMQGDQLHDASNGHIDDSSPFYSVSDDAVVIPKSNPWR